MNGTSPNIWALGRAWVHGGICHNNGGFGIPPGVHIRNSQSRTKEEPLHSGRYDIGASCSWRASSFGAKFAKDVPLRNVG